MEEDHGGKQEKAVATALEYHIGFHRKWKLIVMRLYILTTAGAILCSIGAAILGALDLARVASILSAATVIFISLEKTLLFREKWKLHLSTESRLLSTKLNYEAGQADIRQTSARVNSIVEEYATELPIEQRGAH